ncbi:unnamed protein product, partial [Ilex paraguariensis]
MQVPIDIEEGEAGIEGSGHLGQVLGAVEHGGDGLGELPFAHGGGELGELPFVGGGGLGKLAFAHRGGDLGEQTTRGQACSFDYVVHSMSKMGEQGHAKHSLAQATWALELPGHADSWGVQPGCMAGAHEEEAQGEHALGVPLWLLILGVQARSLLVLGARWSGVMRVKHLRLLSGEEM